MRPEYVRLAGLQGALTAAGAAAVYYAAAPFQALSVAFGGCVAMAGTVFLAWRYVSGRRQEHLGAGLVLRKAYRTAMERFFLSALLLALGMVKLKLAPFWLLAGFVGGQLAWLAAPLWMGLRK